MSQKLFVYGTLRDADVQERVIGRTVNSTPDRICGYARRMDLFAPYAVAMPASESDCFDGVVLDVTDDLIKLDAYETAAYTRIQVTLVSGTSAWMYIGSPAHFGDTG